MSITAEEIRACKSGLFSERDTLDEAFDYSVSLATESESSAVALAAIMVYANTLLELLAKNAEK